MTPGRGASIVETPDQFMQGCQYVELRLTDIGDNAFSWLLKVHLEKSRPLHAKIHSGASGGREAPKSAF